jgi:hypothetical protein
MANLPKRFLMIDERTGRLWKIPPEALDSQLRERQIVPGWRWRSQFLSANKDAYTFLTAEVLDCMSCPGTDAHVQAHPTLVFKSITENHVVYTRNILVEHRKWKDYGGSFCWPVSYEQHDRLCGTVLGPQSVLAPNSYYERRPSPDFIYGATLVSEIETELTASERDFYSNSCCAPYLFRDCYQSLEQYWRSAKRHKEHHPDRLALKCRLKREEERRRIKDVHTLLKRSHDPCVSKLVVRNAKRGMRVLDELMQNPPVKQTESQKRPKLVFTSFFGQEGLPLDIQGAVLQSFVEATFSIADSKQAFKQLKALRLVCKSVNAMLTETANFILKNACTEALAFVNDGITMNDSRATSLQYWTYREFGCPPAFLMELADGSSGCPYRPIWQRFFDMRLSSNLASNVCRQRAMKCEKRDDVSSSERIRKLRNLMSSHGC